MNLSDKQREEILAWGIRFYELGFQAAIDIVSKTGSYAKEQKTAAVREFMKEQIAAQEAKT